MSFRRFLELVRSDLYRYGGRMSAARFLKHWVLTPGVKYTVYLRLCQYLRQQPARALGLFYLVKYLMIMCGFRYGIDIPDTTSVDCGLYIGHYGGIIVNGGSVIGRNCNLSHGVTLGKSYRGPRAGCPVIGDNVFIGPGAKIIGHVVLGNNSAVGANCVVIEDVPESGVVVGVPGRVVSQKGSADYINFTDY